jgi:hypothetical protein
LGIWYTGRCTFIYKNILDKGVRGSGRERILSNKEGKELPSNKAGKNLPSNSSDSMPGLPSKIRDLIYGLCLSEAHIERYGPVIGNSRVVLKQSLAHASYLFFVYFQLLFWGFASTSVPIPHPTRPKILTVILIGTFEFEQVDL